MTILTELKDSSLDLKVTGLTQFLASDPNIVSLYQKLTVFNQSVPLTSFSMKPAVIVPPLLNSWTYKFVAKDGRVWKQTLVVPPGSGQYSGSFNCPDQWPYGEFAMQRPIRDLVVLLVQTMQVLEIETTWV